MHDIELFTPFMDPNINDYFLGVQHVRRVLLMKVNYAFLICAALVSGGRSSPTPAAVPWVRVDDYDSRHPLESRSTSLSVSYTH